ncbi:MAG: hypothetical protein HC831_07015 [Chloroflexia bacterium]|nr:hypothetical protein [Chloroflexia bacterium]
MKAKSHREFTKLAFDLLENEIGNYSLFHCKEAVAEDCANVDRQTDLEFVNVDGDLDNPHADDGFFTDDDEAHKVEVALSITGQEPESLTTFNHFIDIRKGGGIYDDFDGYSYNRGSGHKNQNEQIGGVGIDQLIHWWFNDEYVHVPGRKWYKDCSPSVAMYSFYWDKNNYSSVAEEAKSRFPLAKNTGQTGKGVPYSVFMPVDNMARFWYWIFKRNRSVNAIGYIMHALQDASIPHHAAGCSGNWHQSYETKLDERTTSFVNDASFKSQIRTYYNRWNGEDNNPPTSLSRNDFNKIPKINWRVEWFVTWMAINAYKSYHEVYNNFNNGLTINNDNLMELTAKSVALCMLVINDLSCKESSMNFKPKSLRVVRRGNIWAIIAQVGSRQSSIARFTSNSNAEFALELIKHYEMDKKCWISKQFSYFLSHDKAPGAEIRIGPVGGGYRNKPFLPNEQYFTMDTNNLKVHTVQNTMNENRYIIGDDDHHYFDFDKNLHDALLALEKIKYFKFNTFHWVGNSNNPEMVFMTRKISMTRINPPLNFLLRRRSVHVIG